MMYLDDSLTEAELAEAAAEQRKLRIPEHRHARHGRLGHECACWSCTDPSRIDRWLMPDGSVVAAPSQPEGFLPYRPWDDERPDMDQMGLA